MIEEIARIGRALGIFLGVCLQRPTAQMLSPTVKSQTNLKISFAQNNIKSSEVATDDPHIAIGLDGRVAVYSCRARGFDFVKTPYIDDSIVEKYVKCKSQRGHRNLFTDLAKLKKENITEAKVKNIDNNEEDIIIEKTDKGTAPLPNKTKKKIINKQEDSNTDKIPEIEIVLNNKIPNGNIAFNKVDPIKIVENQEVLIENIKNIPNFVPYEPIKNEIVIDRTKIGLLKTQKPIKEDKEE
jgi:hypothetical protein